MKHPIRALGAAAIATALASAAVPPAVAAPWDFLDGGFGNAGDGSGSIQEHNGRFYYTGRNGVHGAPPHEVWLYPYSFFTDKGDAYTELPVAREHYAWCTEHYRAYRRSDNTFPLQHGGRGDCQSPYWP